MHKDVLEKVKEVISNNEQCEKKDSLIESLDQIKTSDEFDIEGHLVKEIQASVKENEENYITKHVSFKNNHPILKKLIVKSRFYDIVGQHQNRDIT